MNSTKIAIALVSALAGCGGARAPAGARANVAARPPVTSTTTAPNVAGARIGEQEEEEQPHPHHPTPAMMCEVLIDFARLCYDNSNPDVTCEQVMEASLRSASEAHAKPGVARAMTQICVSMCVARKSSVPWTPLDQYLHEQCEGVEQTML